MGQNLVQPNLGLIVWTLVTFVLLAFILRKFAWGPILGMIEEREKTIREALEESKRAREAADEALAKQKEMMTRARAEAARIVTEGQKEVEKIRSEILEKARGEASAVLEQGRKQIEFETKQAIAQLKGTVVDVALAAASKLIHASLDDAKHRQLVEEYLEELPTLQKSH
ncbi:MAG: ATP synthase F0 subunit B [Acidobacteria bacterium]|nr:MAG: ATP synthase F0 subunit B [Acidobacteriota bacterium]